MHTLHGIVIAPGYPLELVSKTLWQKTPHTCITEHGKMKLVLTGLEGPSGRFIMLECAVYTLQKSSHHTNPAMNMPS